MNVPPKKDTRELREARIDGIDFHGDEWKRMRRLWEDRRTELLGQLAKLNRPEREADTIRGGIREIDSWLALDEERRVIPSDIYAA